MATPPVIIVGAGPVGLVAAMDLAYRGIACMVLEKRSDEAPAHPRCNTTSARSMEILRRLGCNEIYRKTGLKRDYPNDVVYRTSITGRELVRYHLPAAGADVMADRCAHDGGWHSSERPHRASQFYLERVLHSHAQTFEQIDIRYSQEVTGVSQTDASVTVEFKDTRTGERQTVSTRYLIGADGGHSTIRKRCGIDMVGGPPGAIRVQTILFRSKEVLPLFGGTGFGWINNIINEHSFGTIIAIDGEELWLTHMGVMEGQEEVTPDSIGRHIQMIMGCKIDYEVLNTELWQFNRLVAEHYRMGNVFLTGDAAHVWPPWAGHGMNTGIEDAVGLTWMLAATIHGWAPESILDAYHSERQNVGEKVSLAIEDKSLVSLAIMSNREWMQKIDAAGEEGERVRKMVRNELIAKDSQQFNPEGLNFGLHYDQSPLIVYDGATAPEYQVRDYTPSTVPGCRAPFFARIDDGSSVYDHLSQGYSLLRADESLDVTGFVTAAHACGMPFKVIDIEYEPRARSVYEMKLTLVRPDDRVAWRSNHMPDNPAKIIDIVRGAGQRTEDSGQS